VQRRLCNAADTDAEVVCLWRRGRGPKNRVLTEGAGAAAGQKVGVAAVGGPRSETASSRGICRRWRHVEQWLPARTNNFEAAECRGTIQAKVITRPRLQRVSHCRRLLSSLRGRSRINARAPPAPARGGMEQPPSCGLPQRVSWSGHGFIAFEASLEILALF